MIVEEIAPLSGNHTVLIARHAETASNLARRYAGWSDEPLTPRGRDQALELARRLAGQRVTRIRSSCIARAAETALLVGNALGNPVVHDERLNELRMGPWEGLTEDEVALKYPREHGVWLERPDELKLDGRETLRELAARLLGVLADSAACGQRELLVTHVALVRVASLLSQGRPLSQYKQICVANCECLDIPSPDQWRPILITQGVGDAQRLVGVATG